MSSVWRGFGAGVFVGVVLAGIFTTQLVEVAMKISTDPVEQAKRQLIEDCWHRHPGAWWNPNTGDVYTGVSETQEGFDHARTYGLFPVGRRSGQCEDSGG